MTELAYDVVLDGLTDTSQAPKGRDIYYRCKLCGDIIPSQPKDNVGCKCGNVFIDVDAFRLAVKDYLQFQAVKLVQRTRKPRKASR